MSSWTGQESSVKWAVGEGEGEGSRPDAVAECRGFTLGCSAAGLAHFLFFPRARAIGPV